MQGHAGMAVTEGRQNAGDGGHQQRNKEHSSRQPGFQFLPGVAKRSAHHHGKRHATHSADAKGMDPGNR